MDIFSINNTLFTVLGYQMSYIEFVATVTSLICIWLCVKRHVLNWPIGIFSVALFLILFWQIHLYSDVIEQSFYVITGFYGWLVWDRTKTAGTQQIEAAYSKPNAMVLWAVGVAVGSLALGAFMSRANTIFPTVFTAPAAYPYLDAMTTVMSFAAQILMIRKKAENWIYWIAVDVIAVVLYFAVDVRFVSLLYVVITGMAIRGMIEWHRSAQRTKVDKIVKQMLNRRA